MIPADATNDGSCAAHPGDCVGQRCFRRLDAIHRCVPPFSYGVVPLISAYPEYPVVKEDWLGHSAAVPVHQSGFIRRTVRRLFG